MPESGVDPARIMEGVREKIRLRRELGVYDHHDFSCVTRLQLKDFTDAREYLDAHLEALRNSWAVDINDFRIPRKPGLRGAVLLPLKKLLWKMLKFYTYRLFSQQREYNAQLSHASRAMDACFRRRLETLERAARIRNGEGASHDG